MMSPLFLDLAVGYSRILVIHPCERISLDAAEQAYQEAVNAFQAARESM
jgi:hypothetical protein